MVPLGSLNVVPGGRGRCVFTGCRKRQPGAPRALFVKGSPAGDVPVAFHDADGEARLPYVVVRRGGSLGAALHNRWDDGRGGGYYGVLSHAEMLMIEDSPQAVRDLADYIEGAYPLGAHWERKELPRDMEILIEQTEAEPRLVRALRAHFASVTLSGEQAGGVAEGPPGACSTVPAGCAQRVFTGYGDVPLGEPRKLFVEGSPPAGVPVAFRDVGMEVYFSYISICKGGSLRAVLHNRWEGGNGKSGYYSLLRHAGTLQIEDNPGALRDLLAYVGGTYPLGEHWQRKELDREMLIIVRRTDESVPLIGQLRGHFSRVVVASDLGAENAVDVGCYRHAFAKCRGVAPRSLAVDAPLGGLTLLQFNDADGEVHIPSITVGPRGALAAVVRNCWWNGQRGAESRDGYYSLLCCAETLAVRGNAQAVRDLAAYAAGRYDTGDPWWPVQPLGRGLRLAVEGVTDCEEEISTLAEHFGVICVDGKRVLSMERRQLLDGCGERERALRSLRPEVATGTRALGALAAALGETAERAQTALGRLAALRGRLAALMAAAQ